MPRPEIYLDTNATAPLAPEVREAMEPWLGPVPANASSAHRRGQAARAAIEGARRQVAELLGPDRDVVFTSGGTEADNQALWGMAGRPPRGHLVISAVEHPAVREPAAALQALGMEVTTIAVDRAGRVDPDAVIDLLRPDTRLISVMVANNETGTLQPVAEIARRAQAHDVPVHSDAVQAAAWLDLVEHLGETRLVSLSGHKIGGPPGIGALVLANATDPAPLLCGGGQQQGRRGGTEPTALIVGFGAACARVQARRREEAARVAGLAARLRDGILEAVPGTHETAGGAERLPNTVHLCFRGCPAAPLVARLDLDGVAASAGSACASGLTHASPVLEAMGIDRELQRGALRLSLGYHSRASEVEQAVRIVCDAVRAVRETVGQPGC